MDAITNAISDSCEPKIYPDVTLQSIDDKTIIVVEIFAYMKIIEKWGTGIPRILRECKEYGLKKPELIDFEDVYKRQGYGYGQSTEYLRYVILEDSLESLCARGLRRWFVHRCIGCRIRLGQGSLVPVSYTHLDVYKRQEIGNLTISINTSIGTARSIDIDIFSSHF